MHTFHCEQNAVLETEMEFGAAEGKKIHTWNLAITLAFREFFFK